MAYFYTQKIRDLIYSAFEMECVRKNWLKATKIKHFMTR